MPSPVTSREVATKLDLATANGIWRNDGRALTLQLASIFGLQFNDAGAAGQAAQASVNELGYAPSLTFSGFCSEIGTRQNFDCLKFAMYPYNGDYLPRQVRVAVALGTYNATPVVDVLIPVPSAKANQPITIYAELGELIENAGAQEVFLLFAADGRVGYASATENPVTNLRYIAQSPPYLGLVSSTTLSSIAAEAASPYGEILTKSFQCGTRNSFTNGYFATTVYEAGTFSGWGNQITGIPDPFNFCQMWMNAFDPEVLPTQCRITFRDTNKDGTILGTTVANVSFGNAGLQLISFFFDDTIDLTGASAVWVGFATDGFVSLCGTETLSATDEVYAAGPSGVDGSIGGAVVGATKRQPWIRTALLDVSSGLKYDAGQFYQALRAANVTTEAFSLGAEVTLPPNIFGVVGQELNIYYDGAINCGLRNESLITNINAGIGYALRDRWTFTPGSAANTALTLNVLFNNDVIATKDVTIKVKATTVGNGQSRKALFIGDSLIEDNVITQTVLDNVTANTDSTYALTLLGTLGSGANKHEGRGGWGYGSLSTNGASPFKNGSAFDFSYYMTNSSQSMASGDSVFLLFGTNDLYGQDTDAEADATIGDMTTYLNAIIASIHAYQSGIKIWIGMIPQPCYDADGFRNAAPNVGYPERIKRNYARWRSTLVALYGASESSNIYLAAVNCAVDTKHNFQTASVAYNARNANTETVITDPIHHATSGYQQLGDYLYACLMSLES